MTHRTVGKVIGTAVAIGAAAATANGNDLQVAGKLKSTATSGAPLEVASQELVLNLNANFLQGFSAVDFALSSHDHTGETWTASSTYGLRLENSGDYGLFADGAMAGVYGYNAAAGVGVRGGSAAGIGVVGDGGSGAGDAGGVFTGYNGVVATAESTGGLGVQAQSPNTSYSGGAVQAINTSTTTGVGIYAQATSGANNNLYGVYGLADFVGVLGSASKSTTHYGVYGSAVSSNGGYGVYSAGNMNVSGTLSKSAGSFRIDHPQDPENMYLQHSFVESPDMMNVYNGNVVLNAWGEAWVELPDYFEALNVDFRYQLTPIGAPAPYLHVASPIEENRFFIAGGEPGLEVSWQVTGIRNDPYARQNRIVVELEKPEAEKGTLIHPEVYDQPAEKALDQTIGPMAGEVPTPLR